MDKKPLTKNEQHVMDAINRRGGGMWSDELRYYMKPAANIAPSSYGGIVASLKKKGYVTVHTTDKREFIDILVTGVKDMYLPNATREEMIAAIDNDAELRALFDRPLTDYETEEIRDILQKWIEAGDECGEC